MRLTALVIAFLSVPALAAASPCHSFVQHWPGGGIQVASLEGMALAQAEPRVDIAYVAHSTFRIETPAGVSIATDFFGAAGGDTPTIVTMNHAHETHWTPNPDPGITHVLRGWKTGGQAVHYLDVEDVVVRNVPTDLRSFGFEANGNSIFIFEIGQLCIGHLGHLHHEPSEEQYAAIGRLDVVMAPVDGTFTLNLGQMINVLKRLKSRVVLPMHAFSRFGLEQFLAGMAEEFEIEFHQGPITVAADALPAQPTVMVLNEGAFPRGFD
ncbi:MAG: MBL fold metallo-hydrolase [Pseudomonadota bacterium]